VTAAVVDTNVLIVANDDADHASPDCVAASVRALERIRRGGRIVIDDGFEILAEYQRKVSPTGQPGLGDAFLKWVFVNQANPDRCERVPISSDEARGYAEFPDDHALAAFDRSDRKFVAVALASRHRPPVLVALDRG